MEHDHGDLRSDAKPYNRDKTHKAKWALGALEKSGNPAKSRPIHPMKTPRTVLGHVNRLRDAVKHKDETAYDPSDSSADEDVEAASTAPVPDAEITYSFDAPRGPSHGSQILATALDQAVERFETRQTEKLIKEEYEVLDVDGEPAGAASKAVRKATAPEEEDYEFVEV